MGELGETEEENETLARTPWAQLFKGSLRIPYLRDRSKRLTKSFRETRAAPRITTGPADRFVIRPSSRCHGYLADLIFFHPGVVIVCETLYTPPYPSRTYTFEFHFPLHPNATSKIRTQMSSSQ